MIERTPPPCGRWTRDDFERWSAGAVLLEADHHGPKVYATADGRHILKLFRVRRLWSSNLWKPYAARFAVNARRLREKGVPTVQVLSWGRLPHLERQVVLYEKLPGLTLRQTDRLPMETLGRFMAMLHARGVFFRSCHLGNLLLQPDATLGLIDIMDLRVFKRALSVRRRCRNWRHFLRDAEDRRRVREGKLAFLSAYQEAANLRPREFSRVKDAFEAGLRDGNGA